MLQSDRAESTVAATVIETQCPFCSVQCKMTVTEGGNSIPGSAGPNIGWKGFRTPHRRQGMRQRHACASACSPFAASDTPVHPFKW